MREVSEADNSKDKFMDGVQALPVKKWNDLGLEAAAGRQMEIRLFKSKRTQLCILIGLVF